MKAKLCFVTSSVMTANAFLVAPINKLCEQYEVYLIVNGDAGEVSPEFNKSLSVIKVNIEREIAPVLDLKALYNLIKIFKEYDFELVQSVTPKAGLLAMLAAFICQIKIRVHIFTGQIWVTKIGTSRYLFKKIDTLIARLATNVLVDSQSQKKFLVEEKVVTAQKAKVLGSGSISGVDIERFQFDEESRKKVRTELSINDDANIFLFLGRLNKDKGVLDLAKAFAMMAGTDTHLLFVGPDEERIGSEIRQILQKCIGRVHFVGFSSKPEDYMSASDFLCLPSYREGFGSVVIEAAAVGIPTVGSRIYGIEDAVVDNETGLLFEVGNYHALKECMEKMVSDIKLSKTLGLSAKERAKTAFSSALHAELWLDYYKAQL